MSDDFSISIRKMTKEDLDLVAMLEKENFGAVSWSKDSFSDCLKKDYYHIFLAFMADEHIATVVFTKSYDEADISNVCLKEKYRGNGIATKFLLYSIDEMIKENVLHFTLEVRKSNEKAIRLYERLGFENVGVRPGFYTSPKEDAVIMWKHITNS